MSIYTGVNGENEEERDIKTSSQRCARPVNFNNYLIGLREVYKLKIFNFHFWKMKIWDLKNNTFASPLLDSLYSFLIKEF